MRIILVPSGTGKRLSKCLSRRQAIASMVAVLLFLPLLLGAGGYFLRSLQYPINDQQLPDYGRLIEEALNAQQQEITEAKIQVGDHLDALGRNLGRLQAQVSRINALGQRLTEMAGLDPEEFRFDEEPAVGGPLSVNPLPAQIHTELTKTLDLLEAEMEEKHEGLSALQTLLMDRTLHKRQFPNGWPVVGGWISSSYGYRNDPFTGRRDFHGGVDIAGKAGSQIKAVAAGVVSHSGIKPGYGLTVEVNHGNGYATRYAHALSTNTQVGDRIEKGEVVAVVGNTGRSTGPHLHFEVLKQGKTMNPRRYLKASR